MQGTLLADRSEKKSAEPAESARTDHEEGCSFACVDEVLGRRPLVGHPAERDPGRNAGDKICRFLDDLAHGDAGFFTRNIDIPGPAAGMAL